MKLFVVCSARIFGAYVSGMRVLVCIAAMLDPKNVARRRKRKGRFLLSAVSLTFKIQNDGYSFRDTERVHAPK